MKSFSPSEAAFEGFRLIGRYPMAVAVWTVASVLIALGSLYLVHGVLSAPVVLSAFGAAQANRADPAAALALFSALVPLIMAAAVLGLVVQAVFSAAVFRAELRPEDKGLGYLKLGGDELRQLGLILVYALLSVVGWIVAAIGIFIVIGVVGMVAAPIFGRGARLVAIFLSFMGYLSLLSMIIWVSVRLSLAGPMTFAERRLNLFGSWRVTKGQFWPLFGCYILALIFTIIVGVVAAAVATCAALPFGGSMANFKSMIAPDLKTMVAALAPAILVRSLVAALFNGIQRAVMTTPVAAAYKALAADNPAAAPDGAVTAVH